MLTGSTDSHLIVIFGGLGDLSRRKLIPALFHLARQDLLGEQWRILATGRRGHLGDDDFRKVARDALAAAGHGDRGLDRWCDSCLHYHTIGDGAPEDYSRLRGRIEAIESEAGLAGNRTFYLAIPPGAYPGTIAGLGESGLAASPGWTRLVVEKPFGRDLRSARDLNDRIHAHFEERQVYRIDHYLGKETVQNLLVFRFGNTIFEDLWNRDRVSSIHITVAEDLGLEGRAAFYEKTGAVRDVLQNHLLQILTLVAMEPPAVFDSDGVHHEKIKVLTAMHTPARSDVVLGRYGPGVSRGEPVPGYLEEEGVAPDSITETFAAMKLKVDNWRWQGVPFYVRTGKRLPRKLTEIAVSFRRPPVCMFELMGSCALHSNVLLITLQPHEGFNLLMDVKAPGEPLTLKRIPLDFVYRDAFGPLPDAYETLLLDVLTGDQTLFVHSEEAEASWRILDPLLEGNREVHTYPAGSWGPDEAKGMLQSDSHR